MPSQILTKHLRTRKAVHDLSREEMATLVNYMTKGVKNSPDTLTDAEAKMVLVEMTVCSTDHLRHRIAKHKEGK